VSFVVINQFILSFIIFFYSFDNIINLTKKMEKRNISPF
jgi:hypothetical protein